MLDIKVLGPGCANCIKLENLVKEVVTENNLEANIEKITDREKFMDYGIMMTPGLVVNEQDKSFGIIPKKE
ncbi:thioredoxin family protein [Ignavibacteria bacterium 4148-Me]|uniref:thioredoxin family protein n=1 Tax=Rosettibacter primus TaxID=3111523 RepID=UPI00247C0F7A|nr:thioredoxin family protein [Ignavibacteria bacterium]